MLEKAKIECPICNQQMKRITATHLKKHGLTMAQFREKYGTVAATTQNQTVDLSDPDAMRYLSSQVVRKIVSGDQLDDLARQTVQNLLKDHEPSLLISLQMNAARQIQQLDFLYTQLEKIQALLLSDRRVASMSTAELMKISQVVEKAVGNILSHLKSISVDRTKKTGGIFEQTNVLNVYQNDPDAPPAPKSPAGREKVRAVMGGLVQAMEDGRLGALLEGQKTIEVDVVSREHEDADREEVPDAGGESGASEEGGEFS
jgi:hypothetical protein